MTKTILQTAQAILLTAVFAAAQNPAPQIMMHMYDPATETTLKGTVEDVKLIQHGRMTGMHLVVKSGEETKEVMLGPSKFVNSKGFAFAKGDAIELVGSKAAMEGTEYILAREVIKDGKTLTLRDKKGIPEWAGRNRGKQAPVN